MSQVQGSNSPYYMMPWLLQPAQQSSTTSADSFFGPSNQSTDPFAGAAASTQGGPAPALSLDAMSALLAAQSQQTSSADTLSPTQQKVFNELDTDGDGTVTKSELETDFGSGNTQLADAVFAKLDTNGDGAISQSEFAQGTTKTMHHGHHHHMAMASDPSQSGDPTQSSDPLSQLLGTAPGQSTNSISNADGSTTTTITYADGSSVSTTSAPTASTSSNNGSNTGSSTSQGSTQNLLQQLIQMQAQLTAASLSAATTSLTI